MSNIADEAAATFNPGRPASASHGVTLLLAAIMPPMAIISLVPVLPLLMQEFSATEGREFLVPVALTIPALCVALFSPLAGWLSDRVGRKNLLLVALLAYAVIGAMPYFLGNLMHIIATRIGLGLAEAVIMTMATALIGDYFTGKARERWVGLQFATVSLSAIVLIAVGGILGEMIGSRGPFLLYLLALPVALLVAIVLFEPNRSARNEALHHPGLPFGRIMPLLLTTLFVGIVFYTVIVKLGEILGLSGAVSPAQIGAIGAGANLGVALGAVLFSRFKGASGPKLVLAGLALAAVGYFGAGISGALAGTAASVIVACLGFGILLPTMLTWLLQLLPMEVRGRGTGLWTGIFFFGQFFAPVLATVLQGRMGGLENLLLLYAGLCLCGAIWAAVKLKGAAGLLSR
jgi:MFS family permease